jgi:hypothetical protein
MQTVARAHTANVPIDARETLIAGFGYPVPLPDGLTTAEQVVEYFLTPQPPPVPVGRIEALQKDLRMLNNRAFEIHQKHEAIAKELAEDARRAKVERERSAAIASRKSEKTAKVSADKNANVRAHADKMREFTERMRRRTGATIR